MLDSLGRQIGEAVLLNDLYKTLQPCADIGRLRGGFVLGCVVKGNCPGHRIPQKHNTHDMTFAIQLSATGSDFQMATS